ncbi:hypothetical protein BJ912DRAFT_934192 [Pholiota molesta]|nr:hypothetical protein BJ912DRAFT_934192 [Pholiota molesta]
MARSRSPPKHKNKNTKKCQKSSSPISETKCKRSCTSFVIEDEQDKMQVDESSEDELRMYTKVDPIVNNEEEEDQEKTPSKKDKSATHHSSKPSKKVSSAKPAPADKKAQVNAIGQKAKKKPTRVEEIVNKVPVAPPIRFKSSTLASKPPLTTTTSTRGCCRDNAPETDTKDTSEMIVEEVEPIINDDLEKDDNEMDVDIAIIKSKGKGKVQAEDINIEDEDVIDLEAQEDEAVDELLETIPILVQLNGIVWYCNYPSLPPFNKDDVKFGFIHKVVTGGSVRSLLIELQGLFPSIEYQTIFLWDNEISAWVIQGPYKRAITNKILSAESPFRSSSLHPSSHAPSPSPSLADLSPKETEIMKVLKINQELLDLREPALPASKWSYHKKPTPNDVTGIWVQKTQFKNWDNTFGLILKSYPDMAKWLHNDPDKKSISEVWIGKKVQCYMLEGGLASRVSKGAWCTTRKGLPQSNIYSLTEHTSLSNRLWAPCLTSYHMNPRKFFLTPPTILTMSSGAAPFILPADEQYNGTNWYQFKECICAAAEQRGTLNYLDGLITCPVPPDPMKPTVAATPTTYWGDDKPSYNEWPEAYASIAKVQDAQTDLGRLTTEKELMKIKYATGGMMEEHIAKLRTAWTKANDQGCKIDDGRFRMIILDSLPDDWMLLILTLRSKKTSTDVIACLVAHATLVSGDIMHEIMVVHQERSCIQPGRWSVLVTGGGDGDHWGLCTCSPCSTVPSTPRRCCQGHPKVEIPKITFFHYWWDCSWAAAAMVDVLDANY